MKKTGSSSATASASSAPQVVALARRDDRDARHAEQELLERLAVRRPVAAAAAHRRPHDERDGHALVEHLAELRDPVDDLVEAERDEVAEHDLDDRPVAAQREPGGDAEDRRLADRRREHAVGPAGREPLADLEGAAVRVEQVLAEQVDVVALLEDRVERAVQLLGAAPAHSRESSGVTTGAASACSTASARRRSHAASISSRASSATCAADDRERVALAAAGDLVRVAEVVALAVRAEAVRVEDEEERRPGRPHVRDGAVGGGADREHVGRVEPLGRDPERGRARLDVAGELEVRRRRLRVVVVLERRRAAAAARARRC